MTDGFRVLTDRFSIDCSSDNFLPLLETCFLFRFGASLLKVLLRFTVSGMKVLFIVAGKLTRRFLRFGTHEETAGVCIEVTSVVPTAVVISSMTSSVHVERYGHDDEAAKRPPPLRRPLCSAVMLNFLQVNETSGKSLQHLA